MPTPDETATFLRNLADPDNNASPPAAEAETVATRAETEPVDEEGKLADLLSLTRDSRSADAGTTNSANSPKFLRKVGRNVTGATSDSPAKTKPAKRFADRVDDVAKKVTGARVQGAERQMGPATNESTD